MQSQCTVLNLHTVQVKFITQSLSLVACIYGSPVELVISHLTLLTLGAASQALDPYLEYQDFTYLNQKEKCKN